MSVIGNSLTVYLIEKYIFIKPTFPPHTQTHILVFIWKNKFEENSPSSLNLSSCEMLQTPICLHGLLLNLLQYLLVLLVLGTQN